MFGPFVQVGVQVDAVGGEAFNARRMVLMKNPLSSLNSEPHII